MFRGRQLLIVTKHGKEAVIAASAEKALGVQCIVAHAFDTDLLGTFTGEIARDGSALSTLRRKCLEGMALYGCDLAIASEGSFGPHPSIFIAPADDELVILIDQKNGLEITARELTIETNFGAAEIKTLHALEDFIKVVKFPSHAVILRKSKHDYQGVIKGIKDPSELEQLSERYLRDFGSFFIETDMRAMHNPSRMQAISKAVSKLMDKALSLCPSCGTPGFAVTDARTGLPCSVCTFPTESILLHISRCAKCGFTKETKYPLGKDKEDPTYCNWCNP